MRSHYTAATAVAAAASLFASASADSTAGTDKLYAAGLINLAKYEVLNPPPSTCNLGTAYSRREWNSLTNAQQKAYVNAVLCLQSKPSLSGDFAPGAKSRYDDFVATHISQTLTIHGTGNFLSWHRYFVYTYETALRNECGYTGYQPYLNWGKLASNPLGAAVFSGSAHSMSGNGVYAQHSGAQIPNAALPYITIPPGQGGGCVNTGPFANMSVNLGPVVPALGDVPANPQADGLGYNPRCLRRDISSYASTTSLTDGNTTALIKDNNNVYDFQNLMQGDFPDGILGVHTAGHYLVGGDPGGDIFTSPGDPYFFLHHAQIDRVWWIWQNQDPTNRVNAIAGTITLYNSPPSRNTTLDDTLSVGVNGPDVPISSVMNTLGSQLCYVYI